MKHLSILLLALLLVPVVFAQGTFTTTPRFDASQQTTFLMTLTANVTSSTIINPTIGESITFVIHQDAVGNHTFSWPGNMTNAPTVSSGANSTTAVTFVFDGVNWFTPSAGGGGAVSSITGDAAGLISNVASAGAVTLTIGSFAAHTFFGNNTGSPATGARLQPACGDLSNSAASCSTDTTNANNIGSGTLAQARLPATSTQTIASGTATMGTAAIGSGACATVVTVSASGVATTDTIMADFNADPTGTTGYSPSANGMLTIIKYPTANNVNFKVCNNTGASITPGAVTLNWRVVR